MRGRHDGARPEIIPGSRPGTGRRRRRGPRITRRGPDPEFEFFYLCPRPCGCYVWLKVIFPLGVCFRRKKMGFENDFDYQFQKKEFQKKVISIISEKDSFTSSYLNYQEILKIFENKKLMHRYWTIIRYILNIEIWYKVFYRKNYFISF